MLERHPVRNLILCAHFICLMILWFSACAESSSSGRLEYSIRSVLSDSEHHLVIELTFRGNSSGQTRLFLPDQWAGQEELYKSISSLSCLSEDLALKETDRPHVRLIQHKPDEWVRIQYSVKQQWVGQIAGQRFQKYWPIIDRHSFHFVGRVFFVYPDRFLSGNVEFALKWIDFPREWSIGNSFGNNQRQQKFEATLADFHRAVYLGGDYRIQRIDIAGRSVYVAIRGEDWNFSDSSFFRFIDRLVLEERNFWNDHLFPYYFIALNPFGSGHKNSGGMGLFRSFDVFFPSDADLNFEFKRLFAHELFHTWNTEKIGRRPQPEQLLYWFSEGFTDYYARLLLLRADLITLEEYVSDFNKQLKEYFQSPAREAPNQKIVDGYWSDENLGRLPYQRGDIMAHRWNSIIRGKTSGLRSLDDFMLALFDRNQAEDLILTPDVLIEEMRVLMGEGIEKEMKEFIESGLLIEPTGEELGPCFDLNHRLFKKEGIDEEASPWPQYVRIVKETLKKGEKCEKWFGTKKENRF